VSSSRPYAVHVPDRWLESVKGYGVAGVGQAFGLTFAERPAPGNLSPCPACSSEKRHPSRRDRRGAVGLTRDGAGWRCHECDVHGDALDLAAWLAVGRVPGKGDPAWREVRAACASCGLCSPDSRGAAPPARLRPVPATRPPAPPARPPAAEVLNAWQACRPVTSDPEVSAWLTARGLSPGVIELRDLARALPTNRQLPRWMSCRRRDREDLDPSWLPGSYRVIVPMRGPDGQIEALHARALDKNAEPKAASPMGCEVRGLVMADARAVFMLAGDARPASLVIVEGVPDFLTWATRAEDLDDSAPAVLGILAGSWVAELSDRVPAGLRVEVRTHRDLPDPKHPEKRPAGYAYADRICDDLAAHCAVFRYPETT